MRTMLVIGLFASACGTSGQPMGGDDESYNCEAETRDDEFVVGITKSGTAGLKFQLMTASPTPPARGDNTWELKLDDSGGTPMADAAIVVTPFMPDHQHGTPISTVVTPMPTTGQYELSPINMWMPGLWEVTIEATKQAPAVDDSVVFRFCIPS